MAIKGTYEDTRLRYYEKTTYESCLVAAPVVFYEEFLGAATAVPSSAESGYPWIKKIVGAAPPTVAGKADAANGTVELALTAANEKQEAVLYFGDQRQFSIEHGVNVEFRFKASTLPTDAAEMVLGLCGDWADGPDAITYSLFATLDGSGEIFCEKDDNATDQSATSGVTLTATDWCVLRIDATTASNVKFYVNGVQKATGTTFAYAATGANATLQPYIACYKASGTGVGTLEVDYVRVWQERS